MSNQNKEIVQKAKEILKELGYPDIPLGHVYELFSKLSGFKSWNVAATKHVAFIEKIKEVGFVYTDTISFSPFRVTLRIEVARDLQEVEIRKDYIVSAKDEEEARAIIQQYINFQCHGNEDHLKAEEIYPETRRLLLLEDESQFTLSDWAVVYNTSVPIIADVSKMEY